MKRSLSGELPPSPSQNSSLDSKPSDNEESRQRQVLATDGGAPTMHSPAAKDPPLTNPLLGFDVDAELPGWEEFAQMLPHTPPVENPRNALDDETSSVNDDERSTEEWSSEDSSSGSFDEDIGKKISDGLVAGHNAVTVRRSSVRELNEILDVCKRHSQVLNWFKRFPRPAFGMSNQEELMAPVKNFSHIEEISFRRQEAYDEPTRQFLRGLKHALAIHQQIQMNIGKASEAMKALLDRKFMTDEELSFVPLDVTNELAKAIARHLPPAKAKAIFDELILHAPKHH